MPPEQTDMAVHHRLVQQLIDRGRISSSAELATELGVTHSELDASFLRLAASHSLVLHPHKNEPWVIHPFSLSPTHTWVSRGERGWWAPCLWCGLGVANLVGGDVTLHCRIGGEAEAIQIEVRDGQPMDAGLWAHFPERPALAWNNVHHFCARLLPFRQASDVGLWAERHGFALGQVLPLTQLADLARRWYGRHADPFWRKATIEEASAIFAAAGLTGEFWQLAPRAGAF